MHSINRISSKNSYDLMRTARKFFYRASNPRMKKNASEQELIPFPRRSLFSDASVYRNGIFPVSWRRAINRKKSSRQFSAKALSDPPIIA